MPIALCPNGICFSPPTRKHSQNGSLPSAHRDNWCFWTVVLEKTLESPMDCKEIQPVHSKGNQHWISISKTDTEAEALILWPPDAKNQLIGKDPDAEKDWRQEEKGMTEDEMVGWHHWINTYELDQAPRDGEGQKSLVCCSPRGGKESDMTGLNSNSNDKFIYMGYMYIYILILYMFIYNLSYMSCILFTCNRYSVLYMCYKLYVHICMQKFVCMCV